LGSVSAGELQGFPLRYLVGQRLNDLAILPFDAWGCVYFEHIECAVLALEDIDCAKIKSQRLYRFGGDFTESLWDCLSWC
jgi:hypothetical protein